MSAGAFRHWIAIEHKVKVADGAGGFAVKWGALWSGPARIERLRSFRTDVERMSAGGVASMPVVRIHVGWCPETELITSDMRARDEATDTYFAVTNAQDIEGRRKVITLTCTESAPS